MTAGTRAALWLGVGVIGLWAIAQAASSPLLQWREPLYIAAGFFGIVALVLMVVQPLLVGGLIERVADVRRFHILVGAMIIATVAGHVIGLWLTSPPDVVDVLLFRSPTPFGVWGAVAMWAVFGAALLAAFRKRLRPVLWRVAHTGMVAVAVVGTVVHAWLIEGAMAPVSKAVICVAVLIALAWPIWRRKTWRVLLRSAERGVR